MVEGGRHARPRAIDTSAPGLERLGVRDLCLIALAVFVGLWLFVLSVAAIVSVGLNSTKIDVTTRSAAK